MAEFGNCVFQTWLENPGKIARVAKMLPLKQGLKLFSAIICVAANVFCCKDASTKTRIETVKTSRTKIVKGVAKMLPLKQGLKLL